MVDRMGFKIRVLAVAVALFSGFPAGAARADSNSGHLQFQHQIIANGDVQWDWRQARSVVHSRNGLAVTVMSKTLPKGSHGYHDVYLMTSQDQGKNWTVPAVIPSLRRTRLSNGDEQVVSDLWPNDHPQSGKILLTGKTFLFEGGTRENTLREQIAYAVLDPVSGTTGPLQTLQLPEADHSGKPFLAANAGCNQPVILKNGDVLLPVRYQRQPTPKIYVSTVVRCRFDGKQLTYLEHGTEHVRPVGRGLYEPSLTAFQGRYFLTMRADDGAYVSSSEDGIHFQEYRPWMFDDGQLLGSKNTQQHWLTVDHSLYLVYTRSGLENEKVFRNRAPLVIGRVDLEKLCVIRSSEQVVLPNDGGEYGNSGVCQVSDSEAWITCADDGIRKRTQSGGGNTVALVRVELAAQPESTELIPALSKKPALSVIDLSSETDRQSVVARGTKEVYQGHPHTILMPDGKTIYAAWTLNHGGACGPLKRSDDGGLTWSELLPVPENWKTIKNCPTLHRIVGPDGVARLFVFGGNGAMYQSVSLDDGKTFSPMETNGLKTIVAPISVEAVQGGKKWLMWYHRGSSDELVAEQADKTPRSIWQSASTDGGLTWGESRIVCTVPGAYPCEPAVIRSPDGKQLLMMIRENTRKFNSLYTTSDDEGETWSAPKELSAELTGDRHLMRYTPDGRMVVVFREMSQGPDRGHFVAWVGTYDDVLAGRPGQYRAKLLHQHGPRKWDCGYPGLEVLPDGTVVATTYVQLAEDEKNSVVAVRFRLEELDERLKAAASGK